MQYDYDLTGAVTKVRENGAASGPGLLATYKYDDLGRRDTITRGNGVSTDFDYDAISRLDALTQNLSGSSNDQSLSFSYNPANQIASRTASNDAYSWTNYVNENTATIVNGLNQIQSEGGISFSYDARGNLTYDGSTSYGFDADNRLTSASGGATFDYDAVGRLYEADANGMAATRFLYDGDQLIAEYNASGALQRRFVHSPGADEPLVWYEGSGTTDRRWLVADERGSVIAVTDASGNAIAINSYDEYGQPDAGNVGRFQYTGQVWIEAADLYYYKARFYAPAHGRFLQTDPIGYAAGLNLYGYVGGDPVNFVDPSGLYDESLGDPYSTCGRSGEACSSAAAAAAAAEAQRRHNFGMESQGHIVNNSPNEGVPNGDPNAGSENESDRRGQFMGQQGRGDPALGDQLGQYVDATFLYPRGMNDGQSSTSALRMDLGPGTNRLNLRVENVDDRVSAWFMSHQVDPIPLRLSISVLAETSQGEVSRSYSFTRAMKRGAWFSQNLPLSLEGPGRVVVTVDNRGAYITSVTTRVLVPGGTRGARPTR